MFKWLLAGIAVLSQGIAADPGIAPFQLGEFEVTAIQDAASTMRRDLFPGVSEEEFLKLAGGTQAPASVNVYLLRRGGELILIDTGYGGERGSLLKKLEALKISPDQIDAVLLTHMHGDHIGGLLTEQGNAVFPKATIHVSEPEHDYWQSGAAGARGELARKVLKVYMGRIKPFRFDDEVFPGIRALDASGHTPGHTVFETPSLLIVGDLLHAAAIQFPHPNFSATYDLDPVKACRSRKKFFEQAASSSKPIAGMHLPAPGIGRIVSDGDGYRFEPQKPAESPAVSR